MQLHENALHQMLYNFVCLFVQRCISLLTLLIWKLPIKSFLLIQKFFVQRYLQGHLKRLVVFL